MTRLACRLVLVTVVMSYGVLTALPHDHCEVRTSAGSAAKVLGTAVTEGRGDSHHPCVACSLGASTHATVTFTRSAPTPTWNGAITGTITVEATERQLSPFAARAPPAIPGS